MRNRTGFSRKFQSKIYPFVDSTNFDNYKQSAGIKNELFIQEIKFQKDLPDAENIRLKYQLDFSENYRSIVISFHKGEHELFTTLVNNDENNKIIDRLDIAYDEIAESAF